MICTIYYLYVEYTEGLQVPIYVGMTKKLLSERLRGHIADAKSARSTLKSDIIRGRNYKVWITEIETIEGKTDDCFYREKYWIQLFHHNGFNLVNLQLSWLHKYIFRDNMDSVNILNSIKLPFIKLFYHSSQCIRNK